MRLFVVTSRTLPVCRVQRPIALLQRQILPLSCTYHRSWSSTSGHCTAIPTTTASVSTSSPGISSSQKPLVVQGKSYRPDQWTNASDAILAHVGRKLYIDENHPLAITRTLIESQFPRPVYGNYVEEDPIVSTELNFDVLGFPPDHPGRSRTDTYYINDKTVLRTHTSAHQQAYFRKIGKDSRSERNESGFTVVADVYRRDAIDRSHYPVFHQMEGARLWRRLPNNGSKTANIITEDINALGKHGVAVDDPHPVSHSGNPLQEQHSQIEVNAATAHLKRSLELMVVKIFTEASKAAGVNERDALSELKLRWVDAYFPFTSPSFELEVFWQDDWLELLGCGIIKQELLTNSDAPDQFGWAFGLGLERIAMLLFNIPDIRLFWSRDDRFLSQFRAGKINRFQPFSKYPPCYKDVAFWLPPVPAGSSGAAGVPASVHENDIMEIVRDVAGDLVEDAKLIDEFSHPKTGRKSMCYRINYRSLERTLTNEETNNLHDMVREKLVELLQVELR